MPVRVDWKRMAKNNFRDFRLKVGGFVENPVELSLSQIEAQEKTSTSLFLDGLQHGWSSHRFSTVEEDIPADFTASRPIVDVLIVGAQQAAHR